VTWIYRAGQVVIADWRDGLPKEVNKRRPAIVVEDDDLLDPDYPNLLLVPLTDDPSIIVPDLSLPIEPTADNGCTKRSYAIAHHVTSTSKLRLTPTPSRITSSQLWELRTMIASVLGLR